MYRSLFCTVIGLLVGASAHATNNIERARVADEGWSGGLETAASAQFGNVQLARVEGEGHLYWNDRGHHALFLSGLEYETERSNTDALTNSAPLFDPSWTVYNAGVVHGRYGYDLSRWFRPEVFVGAEYDQFLLLRQRTVVGLGGRLTVWSGEGGSGRLGASYMAERERSDGTVVVEDPERFRNRASVYTSVRWNVTQQWTLLAVTYVQPDLLRLRDVRVLAEVDALFEVTEALSLGVELEARFDSEPPSVRAGYAELRPWNGRTDGVLVLSF